MFCTKGVIIAPTWTHSYVIAGLPLYLAEVNLHNPELIGAVSSERVAYNGVQPTAYRPDYQPYFANQNACGWGESCRPGSG
jgi:hypothetical protein